MYKISILVHTVLILIILIFLCTYLSSHMINYDTLLEMPNFDGETKNYIADKDFLYSKYRFFTFLPEEEILNIIKNKQKFKVLSVPVDNHHYVICSDCGYYLYKDRFNSNVYNIHGLVGYCGYPIFQEKGQLFVQVPLRDLVSIDQFMLFQRTKAVGIVSPKQSIIDILLGFIYGLFKL